MAVAQYKIWFVCVDILHLIAYNISKGGAFYGTGNFQRPHGRELEERFEIAASSAGRPRLSGMEAFSALRAQAKENGIQDMSLDEINEEIRKARYGEGS